MSDLAIALTMQKKPGCLNEVDDLGGNPVWGRRGGMLRYDVSTVMES